MRKLNATWVFVMTLSASAAAQTQPSVNHPLGPPEPKQTELHQAMPIDAKEFISTAADSGKAEVALAAIAEKKASNDRVKEFAAMLNKDHSAANSELSGLAGRKNVQTSEMSPSKKAIVDKFSKTATGFDRAYMTQMVEDHRKSVELYARGTASPDNDVKTFAARMLPTIKLHLSEAEEIVKSLGPSSSSPQPPPPVAGQ